MTPDDLLVAANNGVSEAQYVMALCFQNGWGVEKDACVAEQWFLKSAELGHAASQYELALLLSAHDDLSAASVDWLRQSAIGGFAPAEYLYSLYCESGIGMAANPAEAFRVCLLAAERGYSPAARRTASMLEQGVGVSKNLEQAFYWYHRAAELGDADATASVGRMYAEGIGVERNDAMALKWYLEGKNRESPWAVYALSSAYRFGELDQPVDSDKADKLGAQAEKLLKARAERG